MLKFFHTVVLMLFLGFITHAERGFSSELVVQLQTEQQAVPVALPPFIDTKSEFPRNHIKVLEEVLRFDLDWSGLARVAPAQEKGILYTVVVEVQGRKLKARAVSQGDGNEILFDEVLLTGSLERDRREIHRLANAILRVLFDVDGIAVTKILYTVRTVENGKEKSSVWEADYDGANARLVAARAGYSVTPAYVPPKWGFAPGAFVYVAYLTGQPKIFLSPLTEDAPVRLLPLLGNQLMPAVSRQRDRIAFISDASGNPDLFLQDFDPERGVLGKPRHLFTAPLAVQGTPAFSPDGKSLALVSDKGGTPRIYVLEIPPSGTPLKEMKPVLISKVNRENTAPAWSPDGSKIAYCARTQGERQIWVYDFATGKERQQTDGRGNKENPSWAPDSKHLVFNTSDAGACELYLLVLNRAKAVKLTSGPGEKRFPSWEPRG